MTASSPSIRAFFDEATGSVTHVVADPATRRAAVIDPVLDFDARSGRIATLNADLVLAWVREQRLQVEWLLETHVHADRLSAAAYLQRQLGGRPRVGIGSGVRAVQAHCRALFNDAGIATDGRPFDRLFDDGESFALGELTVRVLHTPGHTPACATYLIGEDDAFIGDTLFMPDYGSARCDFPGGDAALLYRSVQRLYAELPPGARLHLCHDYPPASRAPCWVTMLGEQRHHNAHLHEGVAEGEFVALRQARDHTLAPPALMLAALQVNARAGHLPPAEANGTSYLKLPVRGQAA